MSTSIFKTLTVFALVGLISIALAGCNGEEEAATDGSGTPAVTTTVTQKTCPIMGKEINESISTEYKGKKVYFCCPPCSDKFKAEPEKYVKDLPQFK